MTRLHATFIALTLATLAGCSSTPERTAMQPMPVFQTPAAPVVQTALPIGVGASPELAQLEALAPDADPGVLALALEARNCALRHGEVSPAAHLAVIDYSRPSTSKRLWVFDMLARRLLFREHVAHGMGSGENIPTRFSNTNDSHQTSLGLFLTAETYTGNNGYSLKLDGMDRGFNDNARNRAIVMHGAAYVNDDIIASQGRLGRSHGCPALRQGIARQVIDTLKGRQLLFSYADDVSWLNNGQSFACDGRRARDILAAARALSGGGGMRSVAVMGQ